MPNRTGSASLPVPTPLRIALLIALATTASPAAAAPPSLPARVRLVVLHTLGGPEYGRPERRWTFRTPEETFARWRPSFGAHWIVWTDGTIWPRRPGAGEPASFAPPSSNLRDQDLAERLVRHASPILSHVAGANSRSLGIEVAHSGRSDDPFPPEQVRSLAWLLRSLLALSRGRLGLADIAGHKDLDRRPAWVVERCPRGECLAYADADGRRYRRRVDPPEALFAALAREGLVVPRVGGEGDAELRRAEAIPEGAIPATRSP